MPFDTAETVYRKSTRSTASPKTIERKLLEELASRLQESERHKKTQFADFAQALHQNLKLWLIFGTEAARDDNPMEKDLRGQILNLTDFVRKQTSAALNGTVSVAILVEINRNIAAGLRGETPMPSDTPISALSKPEILSATEPQ